MKGQNISELVELSQSGDESAFEILFKTFQTRLHHSLFKVLRNYHETEDIVQQAFMRAWEKIGTFKGEANFYTWLYRIGFNLAITKINKSRENQLDEDFELTLKSDDNVVQNLTDRRLEDKLLTCSIRYQKNKEQRTSFVKLTLKIMRKLQTLPMYQLALSGQESLEQDSF